MARKKTVRGANGQFRGTQTASGEEDDLVVEPGADWDEGQLNFMDTDDYDEEEAPLPPPPKPAAKTKARDKSSDPKPEPKPETNPTAPQQTWDKVKKPEPEAPEDSNPDHRPFVGFDPANRDGITPIDMLEIDSDAYVRVERVEANTDNGGDDYTGYCGQVLHNWEFEKKIRQKWGGGKYRCTATVGGQKKTKPLVIGGPSKPVDDEEEREEIEEELEPDLYDHEWYSPLTERRHRGPVFTHPDYYGRHPSARRPVWSDHPDGYPFPSRPRNPASGFATAFSGARAVKERDEELQKTRAELDRYREEAAKAREEQRIEAVKREHEKRESELRDQIKDVSSHLNTLREQLLLKKDDGSSSAKDQIEIMKLQLEERRLQAEQDRLVEERRWKEEIARREREEKRREEERREERDRRDREWRERQEQLKEERERERREAELRDKQFERMIQLMQGNQKDSTKEAIELLKILKAGGSDDDFMGKILKWSEAQALLKETFGGGGHEPDGVDKAERLVKSVSEAVTPALGELARAWTGGQGHVPVQRQIVQHEETPVIRRPQISQRNPNTVAIEDMGVPDGSGEPPAQQGQASQSMDDLDKWGKILGFAVKSFGANANPQAAVEHLFTFADAIEGIDQVRQLAEGSFEQLKIKVTLAKAMVGENHPHRQNVEFFAAMLEDEEGANWVKGVLDHTKTVWQVLLQQAQAQQQAEEAAEAQEGEVQE